MESGELTFLCRTNASPDSGRSRSTRIQQEAIESLDDDAARQLVSMTETGPNVSHLCTVARREPSRSTYEHWRERSQLSRLRWFSACLEAARYKFVIAFTSLSQTFAQRRIVLKASLSQRLEDLALYLLQGFGRLSQFADGHTHKRTGNPPSRS